MHKRIKDINWYYSLKDHSETKGLFSIYPRNTILNKNLICWDYYNESENKNQRLYAFFKTYIDFAFFHFTLQQPIRCFYELVLGENPQKPHFDIDIDLKDKHISETEVQNILENLITSIIETLHEKNINISLEKDVCVYTSHGENKYSFHVIINNYCHSNNNEAKGFYLEVCKKLPEEYKLYSWIDPKVYSITQQFRCLGSQKCGSSRIKTFHETWKFKGNIIKHIYEEQTNNPKRLFLIQLNESLISARTSECDVLPPFGNISSENNTTYLSSDDINMDEAKEAMILLAKSAGIRWKNPKNPFRFDRIEGPFVILKRVKSSKCRICKRIHEHQNPYLWISNDKSVYFDCRRTSSDKKLLIGKLVSSIDEIEEEEEINPLSPLCNNFIINNIDKARNMANMSTKYSKKIVEKICGDSEIPYIKQIQNNAKEKLQLF